MKTNFTPRLYQETIFASAANSNSLVVLPTGLGKTAIAIMLTLHRLKSFPLSKILFLAPTKPLVEQHYRTFREMTTLEEEKMTIFTGEVSPEKRKDLWSDSQIIFSTPQSLENDVISGKIDLKSVSLTIFDEAHRATGDYSYVFISKQYERLADFPRILALTASPGNELEKIEEVCKNLFIEHVEIRTDEDEDVKPYVQEVEINWVKVDLPQSFMEIKKPLEACIVSKVKEMQNLGMTKNTPYLSKKQILAMQAELHRKMSSGERDFSAMKCISLLAEIIKAQHALELLETQGITSLHNYISKLYKDAQNSKVKATKNLAADSNFKTAFIKTDSLFEKEIEHPKVGELKKLVEEEVQNNKLTKIILFTQFRDSAVKLKKELSEIEGAFPEVFVGQAKKGTTGLSQKKQIEMLDQFRDGLFNILIATSVAEEGLDIPQVDHVIFYEPIPSAIRHIQRRGRTGRQSKGKVSILLAKNTRDEGYKWSAHHKEKKMNSFLSTLKNKMTLKLKSDQTTISNYIPDTGIKVFADYREKGSGIIKTLIDKGIKIELSMLDVADYVLSPRCCVELKKVDDFVNSIVDGRLIDQLNSMKKTYSRPILIIEGTQDIYSVRNVHPNAIRGMLATISVSYGIPILQTKDSTETAEMMISIAKRENDGEKEYSPHTNKKSFSTKESQEYVVSSFPGIGLNVAKELLKHFKTIKNISNASEEDLKKVEKVGDKLAKSINKLSESEYTTDSNENN